MRTTKTKKEILQSIVKGVGFVLAIVAIYIITCGLLMICGVA